jgi:signal peptidase I
MENELHEDQRPPSQSPAPRSNDFWESVRFVAIVAAIVLPIRIFIAQPFIVSGSSMVPTFHDKEYLVVDQLSYYMRAPARGEVIIFRYPEDPSKFFIKRIIGLPGETVTITNGTPTITDKDGTVIGALDQSFLEHTTADTHTKKKLGNDEYFVMGDNRPASSDSRIWGALDKKYIVGRAYVRLYPFTLIDYLPGAIDPTFTNL